MELTVDITADGYWGTHWLDVAFLNQDLLDLLAENAEVTLRKNSTRSSSRSTNTSIRLSNWAACLRRKI